VGLDRRLVLGVGPQGRDATISNALAGAAAFALSSEEAVTIVDDIRARVAAGWEQQFRNAMVSAADRGRFSTCFRPASDSC
jgi:serine/threonine-protein kinase HipA